MNPQAEQVKAAVPIEAVVGRYVRLRKHGKDLQGLCPFHSERTPSFVVHPEQRYFKCFGCGVAGDVIGFVQKIESVPFAEALLSLAREFEVDLSKSDRRRRSEAEKRRSANLAAECFLFWQVVTKVLWSRVRLAERSLEKIIDWACSEDYDPAIEVAADMEAAEIVRNAAMAHIETIWAASEYDLAAAFMKIRNEKLVAGLRRIQRNRTGFGILLGAKLPEELRQACGPRAI